MHPEKPLYIFERTLRWNWLYSPFSKNVLSRKKSDKLDLKWVVFPFLFPVIPSPTILRSPNHHQAYKVKLLENSPSQHSSGSPNRKGRWSWPPPSSRTWTNLVTASAQVGYYSDAKPGVNGLVIIFSFAYINVLDVYTLFRRYFISLTVFYRIYEFFHRIMQIPQHPQDAGMLFRYLFRRLCSF